jgi:uncharacterized damage-inducible protein DinB
MGMRKGVKVLSLSVWAVLFFAFSGGRVRAQEQKPTAAPKASAGLAADILTEWNYTGKKLADMAADFPEDKLDYKATPAERTFAEQLLHAAGANYLFVAAATGTQPPKDTENPSRATYKTRAQIVEYIRRAYAEGAIAINQLGDKGMLGSAKSPFGNDRVTRAALFMFAIGHANDHYGQCVVYYRLNGLVPPESRGPQQ